MEWFVGFHGTNSRHIPSIECNNFMPSESPGHWLGKGVYFFIEGLGDPVEHAQCWAVKQGMRNSFKDYSVLQVNIGGERTLDVRVVEELNKFNQVRTKIEEKYVASLSERAKKNVNLDDKIFDLAAELLKLDIVISNLYMKNKVQAINKIDSRMSNVTVLNAINIECIDVKSLKIIEKGVAA